VKAWKIKNPLAAQNNPAKQKEWRQEHSAYWKKWRAGHPGYVMRNRLGQRRRNAKNRGVIAKGNATKWDCIEKLDQIRTLRLIAKGNECRDIFFLQIDGICNYLKRQLMIAKGNEIAKIAAHMRK
jgi:hypothetical protein